MNLLLLLVMGLLGIAALVWLYRRWEEEPKWHRWLTPQELLMLGQIIAIVLMLFAYFLVNNAKEVSAEAFIYGRF